MIDPRTQAIKAHPVSQSASMEADDAQRPRRWLMWVLLPTLFFSCAYILGYLQTPLGLAPQLDAKENLALAAQIAQSELPAEPMYRAMLYPWLLSAPIRAGVSMNWMPIAASLFGMLCHAAAALLVALIAARLWRAETAGLIAGLLWGLNPVAVYYAAIPFDITIGIVFFLAAILFFIRFERPWAAATAGGACLAIAVLMRPHFLPLALLSPLVFHALRNPWRRPNAAALAAWLPLAIALLAFGLVNQSLSGEFRVLPWQGAFNLYSANKSGADGRFHAQSVFLTRIAPYENPARLESEILFAKATGKNPPFSIDEMNAHWRRRTIDSVRNDFTGWLRLKLRKTYYLLNNWEQYNNLTYAYHRAGSPWLRYNPIGWGLLLVAAAAGIYIAFLRNEKWRWGILLTAAIHAGGVGLFFVSARFRLPLAPLLCVFAAGLMHARPLFSRPRRYKRLVSLGALLGGCAFLTFSRFLNVADTATFIQDESLIANAAAELRQDATAIRYAAKVLARRSSRPDAIRIKLVSYLNLRLAGDPAWKEFGDWLEQRDQLERFQPTDPGGYFAAGAYHWRFGESEKAKQLWRVAATAGSTPAHAALILIGADSSLPTKEIPPRMREQLQRVLER